MSQKAQRWYKVEGETLYIFDQPLEKNATSVSIVKRSDFSFYRNNFELRKVWEN